MSATNGAVLKQVREELDEAARQGKPPPGRPTLAAKLNTSTHQVRKALATIQAEREERERRERDLAALDSSPGRQPTQHPSNETAEPHQGSEPVGGLPDEPAPVTLPAELPGDAGAPADTSSTPASPGKRPKRVTLALIWLAAAVSLWSGWVGLGQKCGYGVIAPLPGIWDDFKLNTAITLPISVEAYAAYALQVWLSTEWHSRRTSKFACVSAIGSLVVGGVAQIAFHLLDAAGYERAPWPVVTLVALVPVLVLGLASGLARLVANDARAGSRP